MLLLTSVGVLETYSDHPEYFLLTEAKLFIQEIQVHFRDGNDCLARQHQSCCKISVLAKIFFVLKSPNLCKHLVGEFVVEHCNGVSNQNGLIVWCVICQMYPEFEFFLCQPEEKIKNIYD